MLQFASITKKKEPSKLGFASIKDRGDFTFEEQETFQFSKFPNVLAEFSWDEWVKKGGKMTPGLEALKRVGSAPPISGPEVTARKEKERLERSLKELEIEYEEMPGFPSYPTLEKILNLAKATYDPTVVIPGAEKIKREIIKKIPIIGKIAEERYKKVDKAQEIKNIEQSIAQYERFLDKGDRDWLDRYMEEAMMILEQPEKLIPFAGSTFKFNEYIQVIGASNKLKDGEEITGVERSLIEKFKAQNLPIPKGIPELVANVNLQMPTYLAEFIILKGATKPVETYALKQLGKGAMITVPKTIQKVWGVPKEIGINQLVAKGLQISTHAALYGAAKLPEGTAERLIPNYDDLKSPVVTEFYKDLGGEVSFEKAMIRAFGTNFVEILTEYSGAIIGRPFNFLMKATFGKYFTKIGLKATAENISRLAKKVNWDGIIGEVFEEELAELFQAPIEEREYHHLLTPEGKQRLLVETLGIASFGGIAGGVIAIPAIAPKLQEIVPVGLTIEEVGKPEVKKVTGAMMGKPGFAVFEKGISISPFFSTEKQAQDWLTKREMPPITPKEEVELSKIYQEQFKEIQTAGEKKIFTDIKELGGIKTDPTLKEEMSDLPIDIIRTDGVMPDEMLDMLNERGYDLESVSDLFDMIRDIRSMPTRFRPAETDLERNLRTVQAIRTKMPKVISETKILADLQKEITKKITKKRFTLAQRLAQQERIKAKEVGVKEIARISKEKAVRKEELKTLRVGITERFKGIERGLREGTINTKQEVKAVQTFLLNSLDKTELTAKDKKKFGREIKNIQTQEQLEKEFPIFQERIERLLEATIKRDLTETIDKELKYTKPIKKGERRVGKYDYESNKLFIKLRDYNKLNQEGTLSRLNEMPTEGLSEMEKITARFLSYKTNGVKSSLTLHEQVLADIREMKRIGEETKDEADFNKKIEKQEKIEKILEDIDKQKESRMFLRGIKSVYVSSVANLYSTLNAIAGKDIADKYDYAMYQTNSKSDFGNKVEVTANKTKEIYGIKSNRELNKIFLKELAPMDFTITDEEGLSQEINKFDLMNIYNGLKNDLIKERYYKHFGEEQITSLLQNLSLEDTKLADYLMEEIQEYKEILNQRSIEISGRDLGVVENYWPAKSEHQAEFFDDIKIQGEIPSAMKKRSRSSAIVPEMANAWLIFQRHIAQAEHVKTLSRRYEELKNLFSDRRIKNKIENKYGDKVYTALMDHIETFSLNKRTDILDVFSGVYNTALNNWVKAKVASPTVFARQLISSVYSVEKVGINNFLKYHKEAIKSPRTTFKFMWDNVPFIKARFKRGYSEALQDVISGTKNLKVGMDSITKYTTLMTRGGDVTAIIINGYPIIKTELAKGKSMEQAIEEFQKFTEKTQQSGTLANLSSLQRQRNAFARTFFRFKNTLNQLLRIQVDANIQFINKQISAKEFATKTFLYSIYTPMMYTLIGFLIREGWKGIFGKEDEEEVESLLGDILQQIIIQPFQAIPLLDAGTEVAYSEIRKRITGKTYYYGEGLFSYPLLDDVSTAWSKLSKKEPSAYDFLRVFSLIQEPVTGIPTETILRYIRYAMGEKKKKEGLLPSLPKLPKLPELPELPKLPSL